MRTVKIAYSNMWGPSDAFPANYIIDCFPFLSPHYEFVLSDRPELAFYSAYGWVTNRFEGAKRLLYVGEPGDHFKMGAKIFPDLWEPGFYHYGITCSAYEESPNHRYMPQGLLHLNLYNQGISSLIRDGSPPPEKKYFCDFVYSNGNSRYRIDFFQKLSKYKRVESCGYVERNNRSLESAAYSKQGYLLKQAFQRQCKFSIAMENTEFPGYNSEKLTDPFVARSIPIYWGDPLVSDVFDCQSFIDVSRFKSDDEAIEWIRFVDQNDDLYHSTLACPPLSNNAIPHRLSDEHYLKFFQEILG